ncbi:extracellular solute-binding protein [Paenibacillus filicis]|uniref:Extracellular solute-binding protein n=1 Tax=Paenibacillus filicis TaxID=669464 RepID=A0ABU9DPX8_9BACL
MKRTESKQASGDTNRPGSAETAPDWERKLSRLPLKGGGFSGETIARIEARVRRPPVPVRRRKLLWAPVAVLLLGVAVYAAMHGRSVTPDVNAGLSQLPETDFSLPALDPSLTYKLQVAVTDPSSFMVEYGRAFQQKYPNIRLELIPAGEEAAASSAVRQESSLQPLGEGKPDVMALRPAEFARLAGQGQLYALDGVIRQDAFPIETAHPGLIQALRAQGQGKLYGLASRFSQSAIYYNPELFDRYGIAHPKDGMTWEELLKIAESIGERGRKQGIYGFSAASMTNVSDLIVQMATDMKLQLTHSVKGKFMLDASRWRGAWDKVLADARKGYLYLPGQKLAAGASAADVKGEDPFSTGKAAMTLQSYGYASRLAIQSNRLDWDIVREPIRADRPGESMSLSIDQVYAVSAESPNLRAAWELVRFIQEEGGAKPPKNEQPDHWPAMPVVQLPGKRMEAFYSLEPRASLFEENVAAEEYDGVLRTMLSKLIWQKSEDILAGRLTVNKALQDMELEMQKALNQQAHGK